MAKHCILQVEDEEADVLLLQWDFQRAGITEQVQVVSRVSEAREYLSGHGRFSDRQAYPAPDLILLDLKLPDAHGLELLAWLRQRPEWKTMVVIVLSSSNIDSDVRRAYELGANSYVVKAVSADKRLEFAQHLKGWWFGCNKFCPKGRPEF